MRKNAYFWNQMMTIIGVMLFTKVRTDALMLIAIGVR